MGMHFGVTAIQSEDSKKILENAHDYFKNKNLELVEVHIENRETIIQPSPKSYSSLEDYDTHTRSLIQEKNFQFFTNFDYLENLTFNKGWSVFLYNGHLAQEVPNINVSFAEHLSRNLQTTVLEYFQYDVTNQCVVRKHIDGDWRDGFIFGDFQVESTMGFFSEWEGKELEMDELYNDVLNPYFKKEGFEPQAEEILAPKPENRRPLYLKGPFQTIEDYLVKQQIFA